MNGGFQNLMPLFLFAIGFSLGQSTGLMRAQQAYRSPAAINNRVFHESNLQIKGKVMTVIDGDTLSVTDGNKNWTIKVSGIDSPEKEQPFGSKAKTYANNYLKGDIVSIYKPGVCKDRYDRVLGIVRSDTRKTDFGMLMIKKGLAHFNPNNKDEYDPAIATTGEKAAFA